MRTGQGSFATSLPAWACGCSAEYLFLETRLTTEQSRR
jgi:hypothetical protein